MKITTKSKLQMFGFWSGIGYIVTILLGWALIAGFIPPPPPSNTVDQVAALYQSDYTRIRIGMIFVMFSALLSCPYAAVLAQLLSRIEEGPGVLTYTFLMGAVGNMCLTFYPATYWLIAAYRPDRAPELIYLMNDMAWLQFIGGLSIFLGMPLSVGLAAFCDTSAEPVFPRWVGFYSFLAIILMLPDQLLFFFHSGPFAWSGLFAMWIPVGVFTSWIVLMFFLLHKAIMRERLTGK